MLIRWTSLLLAALPATAAGCLVAADVVPPARTVVPEAGITLTVDRLAPSSDIGRDGFSGASIVELEVNLRNESGGRRAILLAQGRLLMHAEGASDFAGPRGPSGVIARSRPSPTTRARPSNARAAPRDVEPRTVS
jgi:hypothetical protein